MTIPIDDLGLSPRGRAALKRAKILTLEDAYTLTEDELLRLPGVGPATVSMLEAALREFPVETVPHLDDTSGNVQAEPRVSTDTANRADAILALLAGKMTLTAGVVTLAWDLALAFDQEARRAAGIEMEIHDGLRVRFQGEDWIVRTSLKPGEDKPAGARPVLLVPAS